MNYNLDFLQGNDFYSKVIVSHMLDIFELNAKGLTSIIILVILFGIIFYAIAHVTDFFVWHDNLEQFILSLIAGFISTFILFGISCLNLYVQEGKLKEDVSSYISYNKLNSAKEVELVKIVSTNNSNYSVTLKLYGDKIVVVSTNNINLSDNNKADYYMSEQDIAKKLNSNFNNRFLDYIIKDRKFSVDEKLEVYITQDNFNDLIENGTVILN